MSWKSIVKEDRIVEDLNEIRASLMRARELCAKYSDQSNAMLKVEEITHSAIKELSRIDEEEMNGLYDSEDPNIPRIEDEEFVPSGQYISSRGFEDRR